MNGWVNNLPLKNVTFKTIHIILSLLPKKANKIFTLKDYIKALQRRFDSWNSASIKELIFKAMTMQNRLNHTNRPEEITKHNLLVSKMT